LKDTPAYRRQHITQVAIDFNYFDVNIASQAFSYLATLPKLRKLYIDINEEEWYPGNRHHSYAGFNILKIPGLAKLQSVRSIEVIFTGNCANIAAYLKAEIEGQGGKKRKAIEGETIAREQRGRAAKHGRKDYVD
jgi:hypothetical protein